MDYTHSEPAADETPQNVPYPELWAPEPEEEEEPSMASVTAVSVSGQKSVIDLTRHIERKKQKELDQLQFVGGPGTTKKQPVLTQKKAGRNDACPCGSGKKYKKCCGA